MTSYTGLENVLHALENLSVGDYSTPLSCAKIIYDNDLLKTIEDLYNRLSGSSVTDVVLVGIGGSHFGVQALYDALQVNEYAQPRVRLHALTSIDSFSIGSFVTWYTRIVQDPSCHVMTFIISKSGGTFETASHGSLCYDLLKKIKPDTYLDQLCVITDADSVLSRACMKEGIHTVFIPQHIGGRYSIFSAAGLPVLRFLGISVSELLEGAQSVEITQPVATAESLYAAFKDGYLVYDIFIFMPHYASLGGWTRQLIGESLGKDSKGFLPTVSLGSQDLHSVIQQYFGGKQITVTAFFVPSEYTENTVVPDSLFSQVGSLRTGLLFADIQRSIIQGVQHSYQQSNKPFFTFGFRKGSAYDIGKFMQYKMLETIYLGTLMGVNPFDQPQVELYKKETRKLLS